MNSTRANEQKNFTLNQVKLHWYQHSFVDGVVTSRNEMSREIVEADSFHLKGGCQQFPASLSQLRFEGCIPLLLNK